MQDTKAKTDINLIQFHKITSRHVLVMFMYYIKKRLSSPTQASGFFRRNFITECNDAAEAP